jgi:hypothetical protein
VSAFDVETVIDRAIGMALDLVRLHGFLRMLVVARRAVDTEAE